MSDPIDGADGHQGSASQDSQEEPIHLLDYWRILVQRRAVILACLGIFVAAAVLYSVFATREYEAVTTLQIERQGPEILGFKDIVSVDSAYNAYQDFYQTQYKILQSRTVMRLAVERLDLPNRPEFVARRKSPIQRMSDAVRSTVSNPASGGDPLRPALTFITKSLSIQPIRNSRLVKIAFTDRDRVLAADVANAVADAYQQFNFDARSSTTGQATEFLTKEVARLQQEIADLERKLQEYGQLKEILSVSDGTRDISQQALSDISTRYVDAQGRLALAEARYRAVKGIPPESLPEVLNSPLISNLRQQYAEVERRHSQMSERFKPDWPPLQQLQQELDIARDRLRIESDNIASQVRDVAKADYDRVRGEVAGLERQFGTQKIEVQRVNRDAIEYASLKTEIETRRKVLSDLVARKSQTATSERLADTRASNVRVVDRAEPPRSPVRPKKLLNLVLSVVFGLGLGVGMAFLLDHLDNTVKTEQDLQRTASLPALGYVPLFQPLRVVADGGEKSAHAPPAVDLESHRDPRSAFAEAFKNLRTSLLLASADRPPRTIVITSSEPGDGKSTVALNLAIVLTQLGRRVLIVDADLRRPRLHRMLNLSNAAGLSSYLSGNARPAELIQDTEVPNLLAITSGPIPPNPSELLGASRLELLVEKLIEEGRFEHVIMDSPPSIQVADGVILSSRMEATVMVVRAGKTSRTSLAQATGRLRQARGRVIGAVLNAVQESGGYYHYYRYKYYRHYAEEDRGESKTAVSRWRRGRQRAGQA
ncbi:MAG: polysaccharide biosynthesis tyrosine autokinase [Acidobacteriia bacterium]|nr:polysaccharide biosynthesis tyrosine autokinase [Terriglobia bacterium]